MHSFIEQAALHAQQLLTAVVLGYLALAVVDLFR